MRIGELISYRLWRTSRVDDPIIFPSSPVPGGQVHSECLAVFKAESRSMWSCAGTVGRICPAGALGIQSPRKHNS